MSGFEIAMLSCFGVSWPISIAKAWRTRFVRGKSPVFISIVAVGYLCGVMHKLVYHYDLVLWLYVFNFVMVVTDLVLYVLYRHNEVPRPRY